MISHSQVQFSSVAQSCPTLCDSMGGSTPGLPVCWPFNGPEPGGLELDDKKVRERKRLTAPGLRGKPIEPCS